jgi:hypothetical protein
MAKIEFSANFRDAELVASAIKNLQKELIALGNVGAGAGKQVNTAFKSLGESIAKIQEISRGAGSIKELTNQVDQLAKMGTSVQAFARSFDSIGKSINSAIGDAQVGAFKNLKNAIVDIKKEMDGYKDKIQEINYNLPIIEARHGRDSAEYKAAQADRKGTAVAYSELDRQKKQAEWSETMNRPLGSPESFFGRMTPNKILDSAKNVAAGLYVGGETSFELGTMSMRSSIQQRRLRMQVGDEANAGDPTLAILRANGVGLENGAMSFSKGGSYASEYGKEALKYAGIIGAGLLNPLLGVAAFGGVATNGGFRGIGEINAAAQGRVRNMDKDYYEKSFAPAYQSYNANFAAFEDQYRMYGDTDVNLNTAGFMRQGMSRERLSPALNAVTGYGGRANPGNASDIDMLDAQRRYGVTAQGQAQLARMSRYNTSTPIMGNYRSFMNSTGVGGDIAARRIVSDQAFEMAESLGPTNANIGGNTLSAATNAAGATGMYNSAAGGINVEGAQAAVTATQTVSAQMKNPSNIMNAMYTQKLITLGVSDIRTIQMINSEMADGGGITDRAVNIIAGIRKAKGLPAMSPADIKSSLGGVGTAINTQRKNLLMNSVDAKVAAENGLNQGGFMMTGTTKGAAGGFFDMVQAATGGMNAAAPAGPTVGPYHPGEGGGANYQARGADVAEAGKAKTEALKLESFENLNDNMQKTVHQTVYSAIADALIDSGNEIKQKVKEAIDESAPKSPVQSGKVFNGTGNGINGKI